MWLRASQGVCACGTRSRRIESLPAGVGWAIRVRALRWCRTRRWRRGAPMVGVSSTRAMTGPAGGMCRCATRRPSGCACGTRSRRIESLPAGVGWAIRVRALRWCRTPRRLLFAPMAVCGGTRATTGLAGGMCRCALPLRRPSWLAPRLQRRSSSHGQRSGVPADIRCPRTAVLLGNRLPPSRALRTPSPGWWRTGRTR